MKKQSRLTKRTFLGNKRHDKISGDQIFELEYSKIEINSDKPIYLGFITLKSSRLYMFENSCDLLQSFYGQDVLELQHWDTDFSLIVVYQQQEQGLLI